uniref:phage tail tape measure protein n=1 Tax=Klebsiella pneumoniae TaxID=573 RepID=UPI0038D39598
MSNVQALTRLDKSDSQLAALRTQAKKLGAETAFTTRDAASGQAFSGNGGLHARSYPCRTTWRAQYGTSGQYGIG